MTDCGGRAALAPNTPYKRPTSTSSHPAIELESDRIQRGFPAMNGPPCGARVGPSAGGGSFQSGSFPIVTSRRQNGRSAKGPGLMVWGGERRERGEGGRRDLLYY